MTDKLKPITDERVAEIHARLESPYGFRVKDEVTLSMITRIRADADAHATACDLYEGSIAEKEAEIKRLRKGLGEIARQYDKQELMELMDHDEDFGDFEFAYYGLIKVARAALKGGAA